jgi:predicted XRE-type DNA-binding protein
VSTRRRKSTKVEFGSGNVFADLGLKDADRLMGRSQIGFHVFKILEQKKLKQREIASILGIAQSDVSHLMNGHFSRFTTDKLLDFLRRLDRKVTIQVSPRQKNEPYQEVTFAP